MPVAVDGQKLCTKCGNAKPVDEFFRRKDATDGRMSSCKECKTGAIYKWRENNREKWNEYVREINSTPKGKARRKAYRSRPEVKDAERERDRKRRFSPAFKERRKRYEKSRAVVLYRKRYKAQEHRRERVNELSRRSHVRERARRRMAKVVRTPKGNIDRRMSCGIGQAIKKNYRSWQSLVGYTCEELMQHLEKQFLKGMSWKNFGEWHIDHIVPKTEFNYSSAEDPEFLECWSLSNLRPLWAVDNIKKSNKREFLL